MGRQGQLKGAQLHAMHLSDWKAWSQDPPLPRALLRVGSAGKGILLEILAYVKSSKGKQLFSFVSVFMAAVFECILLCCNLGLYYYAVVLLFPSCYSIKLHVPGRCLFRMDYLKKNGVLGGHWDH